MGTILTETPTFDPVAVPNPGEPVRASGGVGTPTTIDGADINGGVTYAALVAGVRVIQLGGTGQTLACTFNGLDVTVQLGTDNAGQVTSTASQVRTEVLAQAAALLSCAVTGNGSGAAAPSVGWVALGDSALGSIRPALQKLTNRSRWARRVFNGSGTHKGLIIDPTQTEGSACTPFDGLRVALDGGNNPTKYVEIGSLNNGDPVIIVSQPGAACFMYGAGFGSTPSVGFSALADGMQVPGAAAPPPGKNSISGYTVAKAGGNIRVSGGNFTLSNCFGLPGNGACALETYQGVRCIAVALAYPMEDARYNLVVTNDGDAGLTTGWCVARGKTVSVFRVMFYQADGTGYSPDNGAGFSFTVRGKQA